MDAIQRNHARGNATVSHEQLTASIPCCSTWHAVGMELIRPPGITYIGRVEFRDRRSLFGIRQVDRLLHMYVIGKTGTGKSTLLDTLMRQDIDGGRGFCLIDPHGDLVERVITAVPPRRQADVHYVNLPDLNQPFGYNPLRRVHSSLIPLAASGLLEAFKKHWTDAWGVRMEHVLRNAVYALLEVDSSTMPDILRLLTETKFRREVVSRVANQQIVQFWRREFEQYSFRYRADAIAPIQNKVGALLADPRLRRLFAEPLQQLHLRRLMDEGRILLVNLARGRVGEDTAALLGSMLVTTIGLAAFSRTDVPESDRLPFYLYLDEFQNFTTASVATMVSELRKYRVGLILANQHLDQLTDEVRSAVLGNVGSLVSFRVGPDDASILAREFGERVEPIDFSNLPNYHVYLRLMIDGAPSRPFSATTILSQTLPHRPPVQPIGRLE